MKAIRNFALNIQPKKKGDQVEPVEPPPKTPHRHCLIKTSQGLILSSLRCFLHDQMRSSRIFRHRCCFRFAVAQGEANPRGIQQIIPAVLKWSRESFIRDVPWNYPLTQETGYSLKIRSIFSVLSGSSANHHRRPEMNLPHIIKPEKLFTDEVTFSCTFLLFIFQHL